MISNPDYKKLMIKQTDSPLYCLWLAEAGEIESCWMDCTNPRREYLTCPYTKMSECNISKADKKSQNDHIKSVMKSKKFWDKERKSEDKKEHICDIPMDELKEKHKHTLSLIGKYHSFQIGNLIAGKYYRDVWSSRSCSGTLSKLIGSDDYMDFYCGSSVYYAIKQPLDLLNFNENINNVLKDKNQLLFDFEEQDKLDRKCQTKKKTKLKKSTIG